MEPHKKNEEVCLSITDIGTGGEGIGHLEDGYTLFVQGALPGDEIRAHIVKAEKKYGYGKLMSVINPSPDRIVPACPIADRCGGCQIAALSYEAQLKLKENRVRELLVRVGGFSHEHIDGIFEAVRGMDLKDAGDVPVRFRNKAQYPVGTDREGNIITGFYAVHSHRIVPADDCLIGPESDAPILGIIKEFMHSNNISAYDETTHKGIVRHVLIRTGFATGQIQVCIVINADSLPHSDALVGRLSEFPGIETIVTSSNTGTGNVILGDDFKVLYGTGYITDRIGDVSFRISPLSFYQVNPAQTVKLYEKALEYAALTGTETVWDLYCGIGTISLFLARRAGMVYGVESVKQAVDDAVENAKINGMENVRFMYGRAEEVLPEYYESASEDQKNPDPSLHPDVIVVDPPRKGCDAACLDTMLKMAPERIVYVSCDPATLARDLKILCGSGDYELTKVSCTDMFVSSVHVETVVSLRRSLEKG